MQLSSISLAVSRYVALTRPRGASLALDFATSQTLDPRITFTRTSNATVTGPDGSIGYAPHNLLTYSEQFDQWTASNVTVTANAVNSPTGTLTADTMDDGTTAAVSHRVLVPVTISFASGVAYTYSLYVKNLDRNFVQLAFGSAAFGATAYANFDVATGVIGTIGASATASITNVGGGWYRCALTCMATSTASDSIFVAAITSTTSVRNEVYAGSNKKLYIWGAQLNVGSLQPYYPTTVKNLLGFTQEFDNAAWTKSNSFVQTNQIRNNTMQGAVAGTPGTDPANWSVAGTANGITKELVGTGTEDGIPYVDVKYSGTPSAGTNVAISFEPPNQVIATSGQTWTESVFLKLQAGSFNATTTTLSLLGTDGTSGTENFQSSSITSTPTSLKDSRLVVTGTFALITTTRVQPRIRIGYTVGTPIDLTLRIGLPQLVQGLTAGDVVATYGTARAVMYPAPDGSRTADKLVENTAAGEHIAYQSLTISAGSTYVGSFWFKKAERSSAQVRLGNANWSSLVGRANVTVNLNNGAVIASTMPIGDYGVVDGGNGWYQVWVKATAIASGTGLVFAYVTDGDTSSYTGDGTSGIYIWGAQLSDSASLDPYVYNPGAAPAASAYYGPRFDYDPVTLQPKGLLIEEQRTNLLTYSEQFDNAAWGKNAVTISANAATAPDGTLNADKIQETAVTNYFAVNQNPSGAFNTIYTWSCFAKASERNFLAINFSVSGVSGTWNLTSGINNVTGGTATAVNVGGGWWRLSVTFTTPASGANVLYHVFGPSINNSTGGYAGTVGNGIYIWGAQLEAGAFPTSYIPTTTAAATRAADVATMTGANFSSWYRQDEGTIFAEFGPYADGGASRNPGVVQIDDTTTGNLVRMFVGASTAPVYQVSVSGTSQAYLSAGAMTPSAISKMAGAFKLNDFARSYNGTTVLTDTAGTLPTVSRMMIGTGNGGVYDACGYIRRIAYFPRRLSNSELQAITA